ncbi:MAG: peptidase M16 [Chromatiales bacterium 21-64-14]|nr:MAG: peptidase M16 [Chromatiales bacterium 21-64-14]
MTGYLVFGLLCVALAAGRAAGAATKHPDGAVRATLRNGLQVVVVPDPLAPVVTTQLNYLAGSNEAPAGFPGMAHAQEHMMFRGSPGLSADQLAYIGAGMGGDFDADTQQTVTQYTFTVPAQDLDVVLHIEAVRMRGVLDTEALWRQERDAIEQEVAQDLSSPEYRLYTHMLATLFRGTPYAHDALGTRASFQRTTGAMLRKFHRAWYAPNNAILVIAGDVQPQHAIEAVRRLFGSIPRRALPHRPAIRLMPIRSGTLHLRTDQAYGMDVIGFRMPGTDSPDYAAAQILADVLNSPRGSLYALVPAGKALMAGFTADAWPGAGMSLAVAAFPRGADASALMKQLRRTLEQVASHGVPPELVEAAKRREEVSAAFWGNSVSDLANAWSQALAVEGRRAPQDDVEAIRRVTPQDVARVARRYLDLNHTVTAILTPESSGKPAASKGFGGKESFTPRETRAAALPEWARQAMGRLTVPVSTVHPVTTLLPNGLRLIVQQETVTRTVSVYGRVRTNSDLETPKGQDGVAGILGDLFSYGSTHLDRLAFQKALDAIGASESAGSDFSLAVLAGDFDRGVQLLADNLLDPALPAHAFGIIRRQQAATTAGNLRSPDYLAGRALGRALFPARDPTQREATPATIDALTLKDVANYYRATFRPDLTTIVVIGDVSPRQARSVIMKYFGDWKASGPKPNTWLPPVPPSGPSITRVPDQSRVQDQVTLAETLGLTRSNPDYYALQLGNHVLDGGFYATRLYRDLRQDRGLVYYVSSGFQVGRTRGIYMVNYGCDPPNVARARAIIVRDLSSMQTTPVSPAELHQAKALALREIPLAEASVGRIAGGLLGRAVEGLPLDEPTRAAQHYMKLTATQVQQAFAHWIRPDELAEVSLGPAPRSP